jgi:recombination protein RecT
MAENKEKKTTGLQLFNKTITSPAWQKYLEDILKERKGSFINNVTALVANDVNLQECVPATIVFAALKATALNLPLDKSLGMAFCIPYKDNKKGITVAQFQMGYKGVKQLALRSGQFAIIPNATEIKEGELVSRNRLTGECKFIFIDDDKKRAETKTIGYASYFRLLNGAESTLYMSVEEIEAHALRYSQTYRSKYDNVKQSSKWTTDFDEMAKKTVIKLNLSRNAPLSVEMQDAIKADQSIQYEEGKYEYVDNEEDVQQQINDAQKAQEVANKFADFGDENEQQENGNPKKK